MSTISLRLPDSLHKKVRQLSEERKSSILRLILANPSPLDNPEFAFDFLLHQPLNQGLDHIVEIVRVRVWWQSKDRNPGVIFRFKKKGVSKIKVQSDQTSFL